MHSATFYSIVSVAIISSISLIGAFSTLIAAKYINNVVLFLVSLAAGTLLGDAFFHILPEVSDEYNNETLASASVLLGILFFFALEQILHWRHCHHETTEKHIHPVALNNIVADSLHNFIDGLIIGASFVAGTELGIATSIAVVIHEIPQELGDFGVLIHSGLKKRKALIINFISGLIAMFGVFTALILGDTSKEITYPLLAFAAGGFIYIATSDLMPELKHEEDLKKKIVQLIVVILGISIMFLLTLNE